jgi:hypothetical protein
MISETRSPSEILAAAKSTFATVRLRTKVTGGPGSFAAGLVMAGKLMGAARQRWRSINAPQSSGWSERADRQQDTAA